MLPYCQARTVFVHVGLLVGSIQSPFPHGPCTFLIRNVEEDVEQFLQSIENSRCRLRQVEVSVNININSPTMTVPQ